VTTARQPGHRTRNTIIIATAITLVVAIVVGIFYYLVYVKPFQRVIIKVENDTVTMGYLLKRVLNNVSSSSSGAQTDDIWGTMQNVTYELIVKQEASKFGINITDADIDKALRDAARGDAETISDAEFNEWYRQRLNLTTYTDAEFRAIVKRSLEMQALAKILADRVPTTAEAGHLWSIIVKTYDEAVAVKQRVDDGEDFKVIAKELSIDSATRDQGGDVGWVPFGILDSRIAGSVVGLEIGKCSDPVMAGEPDPTNQDPNAAQPPYVVFMVSEKDPAYQLTDDQLQSFKGQAFQDWLNMESGIKEIEFHGLHGTGGYDSETEAYLNYQLQRMHRAISGTTATNTSASQGQ